VVEVAIGELEHTSVFWALRQSEAFYLDGVRHALGDEHRNSLVKLKEIYDIRTRAAAKASFRLGFEWRMMQDFARDVEGRAMSLRPAVGYRVASLSLDD